MSSAWASEALARAFGAERWQERGGWVVRATPASTRRRGNSALPLVANPERDVLADLGVDLVQVEPLEERAELDAWLAGHGWQQEAPSLVLIGQGEVVARCAASLPAAAVRREGDRLFVPGGEATLAQLRGGHVVVFALEVEPAKRRHGLARALLAAAAEHAASGTVLVQVEADNGPARALYAAAGFEVLHRYHYRRAPDAPPPPSETHTSRAER